MMLTETERTRAIQLQKRLKFLRWWDKVGRFFCWPWNFYKEKQTAWLKELTVYYAKLKEEKGPPVIQKPYLSKASGDQVNRFCDGMMGDPVKYQKSLEELYRMLIGTSRMAKFKDKSKS